MARTNKTSEESQKKGLSVAIVGFGTVGSAVARILCSRTDKRIRLSHICNRNVESKHVDWVPDDVVWTSNVETVFESNVDVIIELIGGTDPAEDWIRRALQLGKSVVTANKQVVASSGAELSTLAVSLDQSFCFEAAVAGGIPIIRGLKEGLAGDKLYRIRGILNGTCNYILTRMEDDLVSFSIALKEAQSLGYAEVDPTADIDGSDARAKLAILSAVGLQQTLSVEEIPLCSIEYIEAVDFVYASRLDCTIRQVSHVELNSKINGCLVASVQPALVPRQSSLARVKGSRNAVVVEGEFGGETVFSGFGAGGNPTAVSVVSDLESIARGLSGEDPYLAMHVTTETEHVRQEVEVPHYVRFVVKDRHGIIAELAKVFSRHGINVDAVLQEPDWPKDELPFVMTLNKL